MSICDMRCQRIEYMKEKVIVISGEAVSMGKGNMVGASHLIRRVDGGWMWQIVVVGVV